MLKLVRFIKRHYVLLLFWGLEAVALSTFVKSHTYQETLLMETLLNVRGSVHNFFSFFSDFIYLKTENEQLLAENTRLHNMLLRNFEAVPQEAHLQSDTIYIDSTPFFRKYHTYSAKVVARNFMPNNSTFQILVGQKNGIKKDMGVLSSEGIAGFVTSVSNYYAEVLSVLNKSYKVSAIHKKSAFVGLVEWDGKNLREMVMKHLPYTADVRVKDSIFTSQYSEKFLPFSLIGTVSKIEKDNMKNSYTIRIQLATNFSKISYVYVVKNVLASDKHSLDLSSHFKAD